jgi:DNA-binding NtrC family response regulator
MPRRKRTPPGGDDRTPDGSPFCVANTIPAREVMDGYIRWALARLGGDKDLTSATIRVSKKTIYNRLRSAKTRVMHDKNAK